MKETHKKSDVVQWANCLTQVLYAWEVGGRSVYFLDLHFTAHTTTAVLSLPFLDCTLGRWGVGQFTFSTCISLRILQQLFYPTPFWTDHTPLYTFWLAVEQHVVSSKKKCAA